MNSSICDEPETLFVDNVPEEVEQGFMVFGLVITVFTLLYIPGLLIHFFYYSRKYYRLKRRDFLMLSLYGLGIITLSFVFGYRYYVGPKMFPCDSLAILVFLTFVLIVQTNLTRWFCLFFRVGFNQALIKETYRELVRGNLNPNLIEDERSVSTESELSDNLLKMFQGTLLPGMKNQRKNNHYRNIRNKSVEKFVIQSMYTMSLWSAPTHLHHKLRFRCFLASKNFSYLLFTALSIISSVILLLPYHFNTGFGKGCKGCGIASAQQAGIPFLLFVMIIAGISLKLLWRCPDSLGIKREMFVIFFTEIFVHICTVIPLKTTDAGDFQNNGEFDFAVLSILAALALFFYCTAYQVYLTAEKEKSEVSLGSLKLNDVLNDPRMTEAFAVYLATEYSLENLLFYKSAQFWKESFSSSTPETSLRNAKNLYELYIKPSSPFPLNLSYQMRQTTIDEFENGKIDKYTFDASMKEVYKLMSGETLYRFKCSLFFKALNSGLILDESTPEHLI